MLAHSAGALVVQVIGGRRARPDAALFAGSGKIQEIAERVSQTGVDLVLFNHTLSPVQQRNIEQRIQARVVDRVALILDIFALRAKSHEGKLQVELAQLRHLSSRLIRGWTHLERQRGGIGLRGPGETQLETDRRLIGERIKLLKSRLDRVVRQRATQRRGRSRGETFSVSLVGYTNAGKSTLFNALTRADTYAADQLFATLDTTTRRLWLSETQEVALSDTVGFIRDLPTSLVAAFRATLEETAASDLLLHVIDSASPVRDEQIQQVERVLHEIGASQVPCLQVWNKIDRSPIQAGLERDQCGSICRVFLSAQQREGLDFLRAAIQEKLQIRHEQIPDLPDSALVAGEG